MEDEYLAFCKLEYKFIAAPPNSLLVIGSNNLDSIGRCISINIARILSYLSIFS
jgi:hypothetical protein